MIKQAFQLPIHMFFWEELFSIRILFIFKNYEKIVLILGSERNGIEDINLMDYTVSIPMYGRNSSMNVIHSLAIMLYEVTRQFSLISR